MTAPEHAGGDEAVSQLAESVRLGFVGPLTEADQDRCPLCGLDPNDDTLHAPWCATVTDDLCGVIDVGRMCMKPEHVPTNVRDDDAWAHWRVEHEWVDLDKVTDPPGSGADS